MCRIKETIFFIKNLTEFGSQTQLSPLWHKFHCNDRNTKISLFGEKVRLQGMNWPLQEEPN